MADFNTFVILFSRMEDCVFCKIVKEEIPRTLEAESANLVVFKDIKPKAPIHLLIVSKKHIVDLYSTDDNMWLEVKELALELADKFKVSGFRIINNCKAAQEVKHFHVHFLGEVGADREL